MCVYIYIYIYIYICITESLCCTPETSATLQINYTSIKEKKNKYILVAILKTLFKEHAQ